MTGIFSITANGDGTRKGLNILNSTKIYHNNEKKKIVNKTPIS